MKKASEKVYWKVGSDIRLLLGNDGESSLVRTKKNKLKYIFFVKKCIPDSGAGPWVMMTPSAVDNNRFLKASIRNRKYAL